jgi:hypothetical protein
MALQSGAATIACSIRGLRPRAGVKQLLEKLHAHAKELLIIPLSRAIHGDRSSTNTHKPLSA